MSDDLRYLNQNEIDWFLARGVAALDLVRPDPVHVVKGHSCTRGYFDFDPEGPEWFGFPQPKGGVFWSLKTGELVSEGANIFALGEDWIYNPGATALDRSLPIYADPLSWLQNGRFGLVVLKWEWAFDRLREVPRIDVDPRVRGLYRRHMKPTRLPLVSIIAYPQGAS